MKAKLIIGIALCLAACAKSGTAPISNDQLIGLFDDYKSFTYFTYPEYATYNGVHDYNDRLNDQSLEGSVRYIDSIKQFKAALLSIDKKSLTPKQQLDYDLFEFSLNQQLDRDRFEMSRYLSFTQQNGYHISFPQITQVQPLVTEKEVSDYLSRLRLFPTEVRNVIEVLKEGKSMGVTLPCSVSGQVLEQLNGFVMMDAESSPLFQVKDKSDVLAAQEDELLDIIENTVSPAYELLYNFYKDEYHGSCRQEPGISSLDGGKGYYEYLVRHHTSTDMTPDQVFDLGQNEVKRIREEMTTTQAELGYADMERMEFFKHLREGPEFYYDKKEDLLEGYREILKNMDQQLPSLFGKLPKAPYDLKEMEAYRAEAAPTAYYYPVPADGSRPGYFYVNTFNLNARPKYTMTALALHEAVPGHHLQIALALEMEDVPWFRNQMFLTAFGEGWGLYAEFLGYESGMYDDPLQKLGALSFEMWRACRLVVDVGIHYKGWSKEEAKDFMRNNAPLAELDINSEIDRYISWPGQALAYKVGELKIKSLRAMATERLKDDFDLKEFHDILLANGSIPLDLLEQQVNNWISSKENS